MGILYMIRHGQASFGSANYDLLSETGVLQSCILAEYLLAVGLAPGKMGTAPYFSKKNRELSQIFPVPIFRPCRDERSKY